MLNGQESWTEGHPDAGQWARDTTQLDKRPTPCPLEHPVYLSREADVGGDSHAGPYPLPGWAPSLPVHQSLVAEHTRDEAGCKSAGTRRHKEACEPAPLPPLFLFPS